MSGEILLRMREVSAEGSTCSRCSSARRRASFPNPSCTTSLVRCQSVLATGRPPLVMLERSVLHACLIASRRPSDSCTVARSQRASQQHATPWSAALRDAAIRFAAMRTAALAVRLVPRRDPHRQLRAFATDGHRERRHYTSPHGQLEYAGARHYVPSSSIRTGPPLGLYAPATTDGR